MGWFMPEKEIDIPMPQPKCNHKWLDFDWYLVATYYTDSRTFEANIFEPYVCIYCKERKNVVLQHFYKNNMSAKDADEYERNIRKTYPQIKLAATVEDKINDFQLVDRETIKIAKALNYFGLGDDVE